MNTSKFILLMTLLYTITSVCWGQSYWTKTYGGTGGDVANAITPTSDGNFIVAGWTNSFGAGYNDVYIIKIKPDGDTLWTKTYGGTWYDYAYAITPTSDGNFIVAGYTSSFGAGDIYLLKIKPDGDTLWTRTYGGILEIMRLMPLLRPQMEILLSQGGQTLLVLDIMMFT